MTERTFKRKRGFFTLAQNGTHDYLRMAYGLALSLKASQTDVPYLSVGITPGQFVPTEYRWAFDEIVEIPWEDAASQSSWKLENEWKVYHMTPYEETIKLDCDMLFPTSVDAWWDFLSQKDFWASTTALTYRGHVVTSDFYRKTFTTNDLPNVYTAFMYFRYSDLAKEVFELAELIYQNWEHFTFTFLEEPRPKEVSTDVVFALAIKLLDRVQECTDDTRTFPNFVHMKTMLQDWAGPREIPEDWSKSISVFMTEDLEIKIGRYIQDAPVHYHLKHFLTDEMIDLYEQTIRNKKK